MVDKCTVAMSLPFKHGIVPSAMRRLSRQIAVENSRQPKLQLDAKQEGGVKSED